MTEVKSAEVVTIAALRREATGKGANRKLRRGGLVPAILLEKGKTTLLSLEPKLLPKGFIAGRQFNMSFEGQTRLVKIQEIQVHPVRREAVHVDLMYL